MSTFSVPCIRSTSLSATASPEVRLGDDDTSLARLGQAWGGGGGGGDPNSKGAPPCAPPPPPPPAPPPACPRFVSSRYAVAATPCVTVNLPIASRSLSASSA